MEWADVNAEERSERCLIEDGHGGYIMCPECNRCIKCQKVGSFNFDTNRPASLDALYAESEFEPASSRIRLMKHLISWRCWQRSLGGLSRNTLRSSKNSRGEQKYMFAQLQWKLPKTSSEFGKRRPVQYVWVGLFKFIQKWRDEDDETPANMANCLCRLPELSEAHLYIWKPDANTRRLYCLCVRWFSSCSEES